MEITETKEYMDQMIKEYLSILWRQKLWALMPFISGIVLTVFLLVVLPRTYVSSATILVEEPRIPAEIVKSSAQKTISDDAYDRRLTKIQQEILSRSLLQAVSNKFRLGETEYKGETLDEIVSSMRNNIKIETVGRKLVDAFTISFSASRPTISMEVTNELANLYVEKNSRLRLETAAVTSGFVERELEKLKEDLERQEHKIGVFKQTYIGMLPEQLENNLSTLEAYRRDIQGTQIARGVAQERKRMYQDMAQLIIQERNLKSSEEKERLDAAVLSQDSPFSSLLLQLASKESQLESLRAEYKETYPDVVMLKRDIRVLENRLSLHKKEGQEKAADKGTALLPLYAGEAGRVLQATEIELASLDAREKLLEERVKNYERRIESTPLVEQELSALLRDYAITKHNYDALLDKKQNAVISKNFEAQEIGERFRLLDPANLPQDPVKPNKLKVSLAGLFLSLAGGIGTAFVRDKFDRSIRKPIELERVTGAPVLAYIPDFNEEVATYYKYGGKGKVNEKPR